MARRHVLAVIALAGVVAIGLVTLLPGDRFIRQLGLVSCLACGDLNTLDGIHNVLLFVPAGLLLFRVLRHAGVAVTIAALGSLGIEALQYFLLPSRDPSVGDVLANTVGAALGANLALWWRSLRRSTKAPWLLLRLCVALLPFAVLATSVVLLSPAAVPSHTLYGQWAPRRPNFQAWAGRVVSLEVGAVPVPHGTVPDQDGLRMAWQSGGPARAVVQAPVARDGRPSLLARLVGVDDEVFLLAATTDSLMVRIRQRASNLGLRPLLWRVPQAFPDVGTFTVEAGFDARGVNAGGLSSGGLTRFPLDPSLGWALLLPVELPLGEWRHAVSAGWMAMLWLPVGALWSWRTGYSPVLVTGGALFALVLCLGVLPAALGAASVHWLPWLGGAVGAIAGCQAFTLLHPRTSSSP